MYIYKHILQINICRLISNTFQHRVYIKQSEHRGAYAGRIHVWPTCWYPNNLIQFDHTMYKGHKFGFQNHQVLSLPVVKATYVIKFSRPISVIFSDAPTHQGSHRWNNLIWEFCMGCCHRIRFMQSARQRSHITQNQESHHFCQLWSSSWIATPQRNRMLLGLHQPFSPRPWSTLEGGWWW